MSWGKKLNYTSKTLKNLEILESVVLRTAVAPLLGGGRVVVGVVGGVLVVGC